MKDLNREWARDRIEAAAEDSLALSDLARFRAAMAADASLERAVSRARALKAELAGLRRSSVPAGLWRSLLAIPRTASKPAPRPMRRLIVAGACAGVAAVALALLLGPPPSSSPPDERARAVADFELAMGYLKQSTELAQSEVTAALGGALRRTLAAHRDEGSQADTGDDDAP